MSPNPKEKEAILRIIDSIDARDDDYCAHEFNVYRWLVAYGNDEEEAAKALKRHLNIRKTIDLNSFVDKVELEEDELNKYVPIDVIGQNHPDDNKVLMFERTGKIDISGLVDNVLMHKFMQIKLKMMESVHQKVVAAERKTGRQSGGLFVMDLDGISFSPKLISVLTGPYRIMWGTLFDHYPQLLQKIIIVNAPSFVNVLHQACSPFLPDDYKEKIVITSESAIDAIQKHVDKSFLPSDLGGELPRKTSLPPAPFPKTNKKEEKEKVDLVAISVPAGKYVIQKFEWKQGNEIEFFLNNESSFHYFMFHSEDDTRDMETWREMTVGCERPALSQVDSWKYTVPLDGYYFIRYGNHNSWYFSTTVNTNHFIYNENGERIALTPIETFNI
ncbi:hypothetical protein GCK72_005249 [Caenorhabditis remanei]|uniref:CRAL-TRIO domain-containing protein n=1 Tax=Caenorhabditis remanei TaxID=31234 RepID=A0A6A5HDU4_CAERE|nr:hypothetical protein GCK72_005249 [Caenorhabditis remanei]KAF1765297.1 hypothetical protein GCK72_005249 [Caenorhabditis remanei]